MEKIRVLHVIAALNGGAGTILLDYSRRMRDICQFDYAVTYNADFSWNNDVDKEYDERILLFPRYYENVFKHAIGIYKIIKAGHYDIVISHIGYTSFIPLLMAKLLGVKCRVAHSHTSNRPEGRVKKAIRLFRAFLTKQVATDVCACGINSAIWTWGKRDYENGKTKILRNAIDTDRFKFSINKRLYYREELELDEKTVGCVCVARLSAEKNQKFLVEVWDKLIANDRRNYKLFLIGNGDDEKEIRCLVREKGLEDYVIFLGARRDVSEMLSAFDLFLLPSIFEGVPLTLVEAQSNGLPVIASDNVPNEVNVTGLISFVPLNVSKWKDMICGYNKVLDTQRSVYCEEVKNKHFDIDKEANHLKGIIKKRFSKGE